MGAVAGVAQAGANVAATTMTNAANKEIAQMNNAFNEKMLDKQIAYNKEAYATQVGDQWKFYNDAKQNAWDMYEDQKTYNSASAQRERLEAAGLNPYMMMSGGSAGSASGGTPNASSVAGMQGITPPTATPYSADYSGIASGVGQAIDTVMQLKNSASERGVKDASADNLRIEGKYIAAKRVAELYKMYNDAKNDNERTAIQKYIAAIDGDFKASQMAVNQDNMNKMRMETQLLMTENLMRKAELNFLPQAQKLQLAQGAADIALRCSQKNLTDKQARHEVEKLAETVVRANGQALQNQFDADTYKNRVKQVQEALFNSIYDTDRVGIFKTMSRALSSFGVPDGVHK